MQCHIEPYSRYGDQDCGYTELLPYTILGFKEPGKLQGAALAGREGWAHRVSRK